MCGCGGDVACGWCWRGKVQRSRNEQGFNLGPIRTVRCSLVLRYCLGFSSKVCGQAEPSTSKSWPSAPLHRGWWLLARCLCSDTKRVLLVQKGFIRICCQQGVRCRETWTLSLHPEVFLSVKWVSVLLHPKHLEGEAAV